MTEAKPEITYGSGSKEAHTARKLLKGIGVTDRLFVCNVDGERWVTDSYFAAKLNESPARDLWWGLGEPDLGRWALGSPGGPASVLMDPQARPNLGMVLGDITTADVFTLEQVEMEAVPVYIEHDDRACPIYRSESGTLMSINSVFLDAFRAPRSRYAELVLSQPAGTKHGSHKPVRVSRKGSYTSQKDGRVETLTMVGVVMPIRLS
jgi:hypothetical protein